MTKVFNVNNFQYLLDALDEFVLIIDEKLNIHYINETFKKQYKYFFGIEVKEGTKYFEYNNEAKQAETVQRIRDAFQNKKSTYTRKASHAGKLIWMEIKYVPIPDKHRIEYVAVIIKNITEQKISEAHSTNYLNQMKAIFHNSREMIVLLNSDRQILSFNEKFEENSLKMINKTPSLFDHYYNYVHPEDIPFTIRQINRCFNGEHLRFQRQLTFGGQNLWMDVSYTPIFQNDGSIDKILVNILDITEAKQIEIRENNIRRKLEGIFENSVDALFITENESNVILECNETAVKMFEAENKSALIGKIGSSLHATPLTDDEKVELRKRMSNSESFSMIFEYRTLKNNTFWGSFYTILVDLKTEKLRLIQISDVTSLKHTQDELKNLLNFSQRINKLVPDVLYLFDLQAGENLFENRSMLEILGYTKNKYPKLTGKLLFELTHPDDQQKLYNNLAMFKTLKDDETLMTEFRLLNAEGKWRWILDTTSIFSRDTNGNPTQILGIGRDITDRINIIEDLKKANHELTVTNQELDNFVYRASHDLRAPLASVLGLINVAKIENKPESMVQYFEMIQNSIERLMTFTEDLIGYTRNARNEIKSEIIHFDKIISEVLESLSFLEKVSKIRITKHIEEGSTPFLSDRTRIITLFSNLISNAIKYHNIFKKNPEIKIICKIQNDVAHITIEDNGSGIKEAYQERIFEMFYRATTETKGSGLGLYIVKSIVEKLNGSINFESKYSEGTKFVVQIPSSILQSQS